MTFEHQKLEEALKKARENAIKRADFDGDGDVDADDFKTKRGRQVLILAAVALFIILAIVFGSPAKAQEETMKLPVDCGRQVCVIPKDAFMALVQAHNEQVDELARLREGKPGLDCKKMKAT